MMRKILSNSTKFKQINYLKFYYSKEVDRVVVANPSIDKFNINESSSQNSCRMNETIQLVKGLSKFNLTNFVVLSSMCGYALGASTIPESLPFLHHMIAFGGVSCGTWLASASANCFNQIAEVEHDRKMLRTKARVLVRNVISKETAQKIGFAWAGSGIGILYYMCNPTVALIGATNILLYVKFYTPLKRIHEANTWVGSVVGALPPIMGWCAATGAIDPGSFLLASLLYCWQFPHFMALSWMAKKDYEKAGYVMTSSVNPDRSKRVALRHSLAASLITIAGIGCKASIIGPWAGAAIGVTALPANLALLHAAYKFYNSPNDETNQYARKLFFITLIHLPVVMGSSLIITYWEELANSISYLM